MGIGKHYKVRFPPSILPEPILQTVSVTIPIKSFVSQTFLPY